MSERFDELVSIMDRLRGEGGCPWDQEQTLASVFECMRGELEEVGEAVVAGDARNLGEELGDLFFTLVFAVRIGREQGAFTMDDVLGGICEKLIRRHPHIFENPTELTTEEVRAQWERIKVAEKAAGGADTERDVAGRVDSDPVDSDPVDTDPDGGGGADAGRAGPESTAAPDR